MSIHGLSHSLPPSDESGPGWQVVSYADLAGTGKDLAFTRGLESFELPELLLWGRPTEGLDPGADWLLTHRERSRLLDQWASDLVTGQLQIGNEREQWFDGSTIGRFRFPEPTSAAELDHAHLPGDTEVISVAWSLLRRAPGGGPPMTPISPAARRRLERWIDKADTTTRAWRQRAEVAGDHSAHSDGGGPEPAVSLEGLGGSGRDRFGPTTAWVDARIRQVLAADAGVLSAFLDRLHLARHARCEDCLHHELTDLAVRTRRAGVCREASHAAHELAATVTGRPGRPTAAWERALAVAMPPPHEHDPMLEGMLAVILTDGLETMLLTSLLSDQAPAPLIASGSGPWEWAVAGGRLPGRGWLAPTWAREVTRRLLAEAGPAQLATAADRDRLPFGLAERQELSELISGIQTTAAVGARPGSLFRREQRRGLPRWVIASIDQLAGELLTAVALPNRIPPGGWDLVRDTLYPLAPGLPPQWP